MFLIRRAALLYSTLLLGIQFVRLRTTQSLPPGPDHSITGTETDIHFGGLGFATFKDPVPIQNCKLHFIYENAPTKTKKYVINPGKACCMIEFVNITRIGKMECRKDCSDYSKFDFLDKPPRITSFECKEPDSPRDWSHEALIEEGILKFNCDSRRKIIGKQCLRRQKYFKNCCYLSYELPAYICDFECMRK
ncbi:unnamed protein product [Owenia fusiformis]|uniref:Uncharacterized protein n=1 Tax=Owenia fusiformis TaxID=6347 RepID=A0A8J1XI51_OWEFU|nr:unnamed protein product [Owenia fusiformis]